MLVHQADISMISTSSIEDFRRGLLHILSAFTTCLAGYLFLHRVTIVGAIEFQSAIGLSSDRLSGSELAPRNL
jgi:hypothetical protein